MDRRSLRSDELMEVFLSVTSENAESFARAILGYLDKTDDPSLENGFLPNVDDLVSIVYCGVETVRVLIDAGINISDLPMIRRF